MAGLSDPEFREMIWTRDWEKFRSRFPHAASFVFIESRPIRVDYGDYTASILKDARQIWADSPRHLRYLDVIEAMDESQYFIKLDKSGHSAILWLTDDGAMLIKLSGFNWLYT